MGLAGSCRKDYIAAMFSIHADILRITNDTITLRICNVPDGKMAKRSPTEAASDKRTQTMQKLYRFGATLFAVMAGPAAVGAGGLLVISGTVAANSQRSQPAPSLN